MDTESQSTVSDQVDNDVAQPVQTGWRRAFVATSILLSLVAAALVAFPIVVRETSLRDSLLNSSLEKAGLTGSSERITGGWITPITMHSITITDPNGHFTCHIPELRTSHSLTALLTDNSDLGQIVIEGARLKVSVDDAGNWPVATNTTTSIANLEFEIRDSSFTLIAPWRTEPIVSLDGINLDGRVEENAAGQKQLVVGECLLLDRSPVPIDATAQNLSLIAPILSQSTRITGIASLRLNETVIPLDGSTPALYLSGEAAFHSLDAHLKDEWVRQLAMLVGRATDIKVPGRIAVARDTVVSFQVHSGGVHHDGMSFLLPELADGLVAQTSGTIGLDEQLDLELAVRLPKTLQPADPFLAQFIRMLDGPLQARVTGSVSDPQLEMPSPAEILSNMSKSVQPASHKEEPPQLPGAIFNLIREVATPEEDKSKRASGITGGIIGLIRSIDAAKEDSKPEPDDRD